MRRFRDFITVCVLLLPLFGLANGTILGTDLSKADFTVAPGSTGTGELMLVNCGTNTLNFSLEPRGLAVQGYTPESCALEPSWVDLSTDINAVELDFVNSANEVSLPVDLRFVFPFYEEVFSKVTISKNGLIALGAVDAIGPSYASFPTTNAPAHSIAPYWGDLSYVTNSELPSRILYLSESNRLVVMYQYMRNRNYVGDLQSFEVILSESGAVTFQYDGITGLDTVSRGLQDYDNGTEANLWSSTGGGSVQLTPQYPAYYFQSITNVAQNVWDDSFLRSYKMPTNALGSEVMSFVTPFSFFGKTFTKYRVHKDGYITLGTSTNFTEGESYIIAPFNKFYSLDTNTVISCDGLFGAKDNITVTWWKMGAADDCFRVFLYSNGNVKFQYYSISGFPSFAGMRDPGLVSTHPYGVMTNIYYIYDTRMGVDVLYTLNTNRNWLSLTPKQGSIPANRFQKITLTGRSTGLETGQTYRGNILVTHITPNAVSNAANYLILTQTVSKVNFQSPQFDQGSVFTNWNGATSIGFDMSVFGKKYNSFSVSRYGYLTLFTTNGGAARLNVFNTATAVATNTVRYKKESSRLVVAWGNGTGLESQVWLNNDGRIQYLYDYGNWGGGTVGISDSTHSQTISYTPGLTSWGSLMLIPAWVFSDASAVFNCPVSMKVQPAGSFVEVDGTRYDPVTCFRDDRIGPGDTVALYVTLKNSGTSIASNITATMGTNSYISLSGTNTQAYGNLAVGATAVNSQPYILNVKTNCPSGITNLSLTIRSNGSVIRTNTVLVRVEPTFVMQVHPDFLAVSVHAGGSVKIPLTLSNKGTAALSYTITDSRISEKGYIWTNSTYSWTSIPDFSAYRIGSGELGARSLNIGFPFVYFGNVYTSLIVNVNGTLTLDSGRIISPFGANLSLDGNAKVLFKADSEQFTVNWENMAQSGGGSDQTFESVLRRDGSIRFNYKQLGSGWPSGEICLSDTSGVVPGTLTNASTTITTTNYTYVTNYTTITIGNVTMTTGVHVVTTGTNIVTSYTATVSNRALEFSPTGAVYLDMTAANAYPYKGILTVGAAQTVQVVCDAKGRSPGIYNEVITIEYSGETVSIPVNILVLE